MSLFDTACLLLFHQLLSSLFVSCAKQERYFTYEIAHTQSIPWHNTSILFYGDDVFFCGYTQTEGFITIFNNEVAKFLLLNAEKHMEVPRTSTLIGLKERVNSVSNMKNEETLRHYKQVYGEHDFNDMKVDTTKSNSSSIFSINYGSSSVTGETLHVQDKKSMNAKRRMVLKDKHETNVMKRERKKKTLWGSSDSNYTQGTAKGSYSLFTETKAHIEEGHNFFQETLRYTTPKPTIIILQFGINDILIDHSPSDNFEYFEFYLGAIVSKALSENIEIIICTPTLFGDDVYENSPENHALERITGIAMSVAKYYDVSFLDMFSFLYKFTEKYNIHRHKRHVLTRGDGKTLNDAGNKIFARQLLELFGMRYEEGASHNVVKNHQLLKSIPSSTSKVCEVNQCDNNQERKKILSIEHNADSTSSVQVIGSCSPVNTITLLEEDAMFSLD